MNNHINSARRPPLSTALPSTLDAQSSAGLHARRNFDFHLLLALDAARAAAVCARALNHASGAATRLASSSDRKEALLITNLAGAAAVVAILRLRARSGAVSFAGFAGFQ